MIMGQFSRIAFLLLVIISLQSARSVPLVARSFLQPNQNQNNQFFSNGVAVDQNGNLIQPQDQNGFGPNGFGQNGFGPNGFGSNGFGPNGFGPNGFGPNGFGPNGFGQNGFGNPQFGNNQFPGNPNSLQPGADPDVWEDMGLEGEGQRGNGGDPCHDTAMAEPENDYGTTGVCGVVRDPRSN
ncbi:hypothetical protein PCANC_13626 [Puccinia coronata f. sp. avenae]|uniref:Uncharacterized protein n=1 Tax=Puccinia coronata f. sp. avenae TaxID=200324 RepID=A0A2N5UKB0_9BASI|nr:hypothetical protein PCANC_13626 [Puccinia coronata f. sp. avenae]